MTELDRELGFSRRTSTGRPTPDVMRTMRACWLLLLAAIAASSVEALPEQEASGLTLSFDRLAADAVAGDPERQFDQEEIAADESQRRAAGRWVDPEAVVAFGTIAELHISRPRSNRQQFDATLIARVRTLGFGLFAADEKAAAARSVARRMSDLAQVLVARDPAGPAPWLELASLQAGSN